MSHRKTYVRLLRQDSG